MRRTLPLLALAVLLLLAFAGVAQAMKHAVPRQRSVGGKHCDSTIYYFSSRHLLADRPRSLHRRKRCRLSTKNTVTATIREGVITTAYFPNHTIYRDSPYYWYPDYCLTRKTSRSFSFCTCPPAAAGRPPTPGTSELNRRPAIACLLGLILALMVCAGCGKAASGSAPSHDQEPPPGGPGRSPSQREASGRLVMGPGARERLA